MYVYTHIYKALIQCRVDTSTLSSGYEIIKRIYLTIYKISQYYKI